jgi:hypothetical protein
VVSTGTQWRRDGSVDGGDGMARGRHKGTGTQGAKPCWWVSNGEVTGRVVAGGDRVDSRSRARERERANKRGPPARERAIVREEGGRGQAVSGERGRVGVGPRGRGEKLGPESAQPGGGRNSFFFFFFYFHFYFSFSFYIISFSFKQIFI